MFNVQFLITKLFSAKKARKKRGIFLKRMKMDWVLKCKDNWMTNKIEEIQTWKESAFSVWVEWWSSGAQCSTTFSCCSFFSTFSLLSVMNTEHWTRLIHRECKVFVAIYLFIYLHWRKRTTNKMDSNWVNETSK